MANQTNQTPKKGKKFLKLISDGYTVKDACKEIRVARCTVYVWRNDCPEFKQGWEEAIDMGTDAIEDEALRRAVHGVEKPIGFYKGEPGAYIREYSDNLLMFLLKGRRPEKYRDRTEAVNRNINTDIDLSEEDSEILDRYIRQKVI